MPTPNPARTFAVCRLTWRTVAGSGRHWLRGPGDLPLATFAAAQAAEDDCAARETAARGRVHNPFLCGASLAELTTLPGDLLADFIQEAGLDPVAAPADVRAWAAWWDAGHARWAAGQRAHVWAGLNRLRFYRVRTVEPTGTAVVALPWGPFSSASQFSGCEGGVPVAVFRDAARAREYVAAGEKRRNYAPPTPDDLADRTPIDAPNYRQGGWALRRRFEPADPHADPDELIPVMFDTDSPGFEAYPVALHAPRQRRGYAVCRHGLDYAYLVRGRPFLRESFAGGHQPHRRLVPVAVFGTGEEADADAAARDAAVRAEFDPFRLCRDEASARPLDEWSSLGEAEIVQQLTTLGHSRNNSDAPDRTSWAAWWDQHAPGWDAHTRAAVWALFDRVTFHAVTPVALEG